MHGVRSNITAKQVVIWILVFLDINTKRNKDKYSLDRVNKLAT